MSATATETPVLERPPAVESLPQRWTPSARGWAARLGLVAAVIGLIVWVTAVVPQFWADRIAHAAVYALIGLSLNVILGYTGQVSLGHHAFIGIAAFTAAYYATEVAGCPAESCPVGAFATATFLAIFTGALAAGLLGVVALRIRGLYLALITLAYGFMAENSLFEIPALTGGGAGMPAPRPAGFTTDRAFAYLCLAFLALVLFVDWRFVKSKVGRAVIAIKNSEPVAASYGINVTGYKILAFILSGMIAGLAGSLFAFRTTNVVAGDFSFAVAILWVLMVVVGGLGRRIGVIIGSAFFALFPFLIELWSGLEHFVLQDLGRAPGFFTIVIGSLLAMFTIISFPGGIAEQLSPITRWVSGERFSLHPEGHEKPKKHHDGLLTKLGLKKEGHGADAALDALARLTTTTVGPNGEKIVRGTDRGPGKFADISAELRAGEEKGS
jgi:branched-chain amino acid transport system permease protein